MSKENVEQIVLNSDDQEVRKKADQYHFEIRGTAKEFWTFVTISVAEMCVAIFGRAPVTLGPDTGV